MNTTVKDIKSIVINGKTYEERSRIIEQLGVLSEEVGQKSIFLIGSGDEENALASAIIGVDDKSCAVVYDREKLLAALMEWNDWNETEAEEWLEYNTIRSLDYLSPHGEAPRIVNPIDSYL
jgi:hypothetical protein